MDLMHFWRRLSAHCRNCWAATFKDGSLFVCVLNQFWTRSFRIVVTAGFKKTIFRTLTFYKVCYQSQYTIMMRSLNLLLPNQQKVFLNKKRAKKTHSEDFGVYYPNAQLHDFTKQGARDGRGAGFRNGISLATSGYFSLQKKYPRKRIYLRDLCRSRMALCHLRGRLNHLSGISDRWRHKYE